MRIFKNILDFYIESSLHVAFAVYSLIRVTFFKLNIPYDEPVAYFGFYGTIVGYNFIKYDELARIKKVELTTKFKMIIVLSILAGLAAFYYFLELKTNTKIIGVLSFFITALYTLPFFPKKRNMRNWSGVKIYLVAIAWVAVTVVLPVLNSDYGFNSIVILKCFQRFVLVFVLMLIFEIIDLQFDDVSLKTIPQKIGIKNTKRLIYFLSILFLLFEYFKPNITLEQIVEAFLVAATVSIFACYSNSKRNQYYTSFWVEAIPVFWLILLLIFG